MGVLGLLLAALGGKQRQSPPRPFVLLLCTLLLGIIAFQLLPLPVPLLSFLSPTRKEVVQAAEPVLGPQPFAPLSAVPLATVNGLLQFAAYIVTMLAVRQVARRFLGRVWICALPLILLGTAEAVLGLFQYYAGDGTAHGTYVSRDHYAGLLEMTMPLAVMWAVDLLRRRREGEPEMGLILAACTLLGLAAIMLLAIIHSISRMGFVGGLAALFAMGALALVTARRAGWKRRASIAALSFAVALAFVFLPLDRLIERFGNISTAEGISADMRLQLWRDTLPLIGAYPLFGCGLGAYESCFMRYKTAAPLYAVEFAHNDYLQLAAEIGIPGFLLVLTLAILALSRIVRGVRSRQRYLELGCFGAFVAIGMHSFVDFGLHVPANAMTLVWILGLSAAPRNVPE